MITSPCSLLTSIDGESRRRELEHDGASWGSAYFRFRWRSESESSLPSPDAADILLLLFVISAAVGWKGSTESTKGLFTHAMCNQKDVL